MNLSELLSGIDGRLARIEGAKGAGDATAPTASRAVLPGADPSLVEHVAKGGTIGRAGEIVPGGVTISEPAGRKPSQAGAL
jgi:hypothetical protein